VGKTVLITGGAKRIGKSIVYKLASSGYNIALHYNKSKKDALKIKNKLKNKYKVICEIFKIDLSNEKQTAKLIKMVLLKFDKIDILINNASIFFRSNIINTDLKLYNMTMNINFKAPFILSRDFAVKLKTGLIINILDTKIEKNNSSYAVYTITKKALKSLTFMCANEFGPHIRVNGIAPGIILAPEGKSDEYLDKMAEKIPLKKKGSLDDINNAVEYLIKNEYITGQIIYIDGGQHL